MSIWSPTPAASFRPSDRQADAPAPVLERVLRCWFAGGLLGVCLVPALRGSSEWVGWGPLWLVGMPLVAWWALHQFRLPPVVPALASRLRRPRPRPRAQARRRGQGGRAAARRAAALAALLPRAW